MASCLFERNLTSCGIRGQLSRRLQLLCLLRARCMKLNSHPKIPPLLICCFVLYKAYVFAVVPTILLNKSLARILI